MARTQRKGAWRYLLLAIIPQALAKGFEAMGDRAVLEAGQGNGAGTPYYLVALVLTLVAAGLFLFALKRLYGQMTGKDRNDANPQSDPKASIELAETFSDQDTFDPDEVMRRYMANRQAPPPANPTPASRGGFGKRGL